MVSNRFFKSHAFTGPHMCSYRPPGKYKCETSQSHTGAARAIPHKTLQSNNENQSNSHNENPKQQ